MCELFPKDQAEFFIALSIRLSVSPSVCLVDLLLIGRVDASGVQVINAATGAMNQASDKASTM